MITIYHVRLHGPLITLAVLFLFLSQTAVTKAYQDQGDDDVIRIKTNLVQLDVARRLV